MKKANRETPRHTMSVRMGVSRTPKPKQRWKSMQADIRTPQEMNARCTQQKPIAKERENQARAPSSEKSNIHSVIQSLPPDRSTQTCRSMKNAPSGGTTPTTKRENRQSHDRPRNR